MDWEVIVRMDGAEETYSVEADRYYEARMLGIAQFLEDHQVPGTPTEFLSRKKGLIEVSARSRIDRRRRVPGDTFEFYLEQVDKLRAWVRRSSLPAEVKRTVSSLLLQAREELDGAGTLPN